MTENIYIIVAVDYPALPLLMDKCIGENAMQRKSLNGNNYVLKFSEYFSELENHHLYSQDTILNIMNTPEWTFDDI